MASKATKVIAEICLYGTQEASGWLATLEGGAMLGDGKPKSNRSFTETIWQACDHVLRAFGACGERPRKALVRVYEPKGRFMAEVDARHPGYYGELKWQPATVYVISMEEILKHAEKAS